ncbi:MAG TPA: hypothetical protein VHX11_08900 [Acidobacteriaceae bacterium]|nr:hypothetical protein [Acidobacteriaceae bacterium]
MSTETTTLFPPPLRGQNASNPQTLYLFSLQKQLPLKKVDTSAGDYAEDAPDPGGTSGQNNQNQEISYLKTSSDANVFTLNGVEGGPYTLTALYDHLRIKSDASKWWRIG